MTTPAGVTSPAQFAWTTSKSAPVPTDEAQSAIVSGKLLVFGGFDFRAPVKYTPLATLQVYDPTTGTWAYGPAMPYPITHAGIATDGVRYVYYVAGYAPNPAYTAPLIGTVHGEQFDTLTGAYAPLPDLPTPRGAGGLALVGQTLYYFGGTNVDRTADSGLTWALDLTNTAAGWVPRAPMPNPRNHLGSAVSGGEIYAIGGMHLAQSWTSQPDVDSYDPPTNTWTVRAPLNNPARNHIMDSTSVAGDGRIFVLGGWNAGALANVSIYTPSTDTWVSGTPMPQGRTSATGRIFPTSNQIVDTEGSGGPSSGTTWVANPIG